MKSFFRNFTKHDYIFFALAGVLYFALIYFYIPCVEDLMYRFSSVTKKPIAGLSDALLSQTYDYMHANGRYIVHTFVQLFCGAWGAMPCLVLSAIAFSVLLLGMTWWVRHQYGTMTADKYLLVVGILFFIPVIGLTFLGHIAFLVNYVWGAAIYMVFMCLYFHIRDEKPTLQVWQQVLLCLFAAVAGSWQESFGLGIAGALFFYHICRLRETRGLLLAFLLCFAAGICTEIFAPGNFSRFLGANATNSEEVFSLAAWLGGKLYNIKMLVKHCPAISIFALLLVLIPVLQRRRTWSFVRENYYLIVPCVLMFIFGCFAAFSGEHQFVVIGLFSTILLVNLLISTWGQWLEKHKRWVMIACGVVIAIIYVPSFHYRHLYYDANKPFEQSMLQSSDSTCLSTELEHIDREVIASSFYRRYTDWIFVHYNYDTRMYTTMYSKYISPDRKVHVTTALPESKEQIIAHCCEQNRLADSIYNAPTLEYYIVRLPKEVDATKVLCTEVVQSKFLKDKAKDVLMRRQGRKTESTAPLRGFIAGDEYSRWFIEGEYRYIIRVKPYNRTLTSVSLSYAD